ncbi:MAG: NADH-quinone oxidoreductase subunit NuoK [Proteobacteria bacterium]|nr:NADH-quinone oxidoreductase subunit NuoK [Pseudomonadota bacterium]
MNNIQFILEDPILRYIILSCILFVIGFCGIVINRKGLISILMSLEIMLLAVSIAFTTFAIALNDLHGQIFTVFILTVAAAEAAIGLAIIVSIFREKDNINISTISDMKG